MDGWEISKHAIQRALDMALTPDQIRDVLTRPKEKYLSPKYPNSEYFGRDEVTAAVSRPAPDGTRIVFTFLWRHRTGWEDDYVFPPAPGREARWERREL